MPKELTQEYYCNYLNYNLEKLGLIAPITDPNGRLKREQIERVVNYTFTSKKDKFPNRQSLNIFLKELVTIYNKNNLDLDDFKSYLHQGKREAFSNFVLEFFKRISIDKPAEYDGRTLIIDIAAWIDFEFQKNTFFKSDNAIIAWLLVTYILKINGLQLPQVLSKEEVISHLPNTAADLLFNVVSKIPNSLLPNSYLLIKINQQAWQLLYVNIIDSKTVEIQVNSVNGLDSALKGLASDRIPEEMTDDEKKVIKEPIILYRNNALFSAEALKSWTTFYRSQFGAWEIGKKETFDQSLNSNETMLREITRTVEDIREMQNITGETSLEKLVVHKIDRAVLQALIINLVAKVQVKNEESLSLLVKKLYATYTQNFELEDISMKRNFLYYIYNQINDSVIVPTKKWQQPRKFSRDLLIDEIKNKESYFNKLFEVVEKNKFFLGNDQFEKDDVIHCQEIMVEKEKLINEHDNSLPKKSYLKNDFEKKHKVYRMLVIDKMLRDFIEQRAEQWVDSLIEFSLKNDKELKKLILRENLGRVTWVIAGGPASGKTTIVEMAEKDLANDKINTAVLNPDYYKKILLDPNEVSDPIKHAELTHVESSYINKKIMEKIKSLIAKGKAPDVLFDAVKASQDKIGVTKEGNATVNIYMATCSPEEAVRRAFDRGRRHGRFVPTEIILDGHKEATRLLPEVLAKNNVIFKLFYTGLPQGEPPVEIASIYDRSNTLDIHDAKLMLEFVLKSKINVSAKSPEEVYDGEVYKDKVKQITLCLIDYITHGLTLRFGYHSKAEGQYKTYAIISHKEGFLVTNIAKFIDSFGVGINANSDKKEYREYTAQLIFNLSQSEIDGKKLSISVHSGETSRKDLYIEQGKCFYCTQLETEFSEMYKKIQLLVKPSANVNVSTSHSGNMLTTYTYDNARHSFFAIDNAFQNISGQITSSNMKEDKNELSDQDTEHEIVEVD